MRSTRASVIKWYRAVLQLFGCLARVMGSLAQNLSFEAVDENRSALLLLFFHSSTSFLSFFIRFSCLLYFSHCNRSNNGVAYVVAYEVITDEQILFYIILLNYT